ncbi:MAG: LPS assembly protein LptD [Xanthomonadales bacterium]|nr:LPS assembly protein LptD [Xanthomonadales bacterium]
MLSLPVASFAMEKNSPQLPQGCPLVLTEFEVPELENRQDLPIDISAIEGDFARPMSVFTGDVVVTRGAQQLKTDLLKYNIDKKHLNFPEPLAYRDAGLFLLAASAEYDLLEESGSFQQVDYQLFSNNSKGRASKALVSKGSQLSMDGVEYTTCQGDDPDWQIIAKNISINAQTGRGIARGAKLEIKGIPVLYTPWLSFPIDDRRQTGFLYPSLGSSNDNGFDVSIPWYWNIAPNQDLTLTPRWITDRGFMLGSQYRFMTARTINSVDIKYLADDDRTGEDRYHYKVSHKGIINPQWKTKLLLNRVSDEDYFFDLGNSLVQSSRQFLRSQVGISGRGKYWGFDLQADNFQILDAEINPNRGPYSRVPQLRYRLDMPINKSRFDFRLDSELVAFDRRAGVTGGRADVLSQLLWTYEEAAGFVQPAIAYRVTQYSLNNNLDFVDNSPGRSNLIASFDAGLYFDRELKSGAQQTLEPRLFYLFVPFENQDDLPDFDTDEMTFGFGQLFSYNRFIGADRQGDANQLTLALTSRTFDSTQGLERFNLSLGQILYFADQKVQLRPGDPVNKAGTSDFIAEASWYPSQVWATRAGLQWSWEENELDVGYAGIDYQSSSRLQLSFEYRYRLDSVDQFDIRASVPISSRWRLMGRWNYDRDEAGTLEALAGFEYSSCCWAMRLLARRYLRNNDGETRTGIYLEFELTGLGILGREPYKLFNDRNF